MNLGDYSSFALDVEMLLYMLLGLSRDGLYSNGVTLVVCSPQVWKLLYPHASPQQQLLITYAGTNQSTLFPTRNILEPCTTFEAHVSTNTSFFYMTTLDRQI